MSIDLHFRKREERGVFSRVIFSEVSSSEREKNIK